LQAVSARDRLQAGKVLGAQMAAQRQPVARLPPALQQVAASRQAQQAQAHSAALVPQQPKQPKQ
jgi:hypothetical protein